MNIKNKISELETRLSTKFDEYKNEHPGTHKTPADPMFQDIENHLKDHDWFHEMADRGEAVDQGRRHAGEIGRKLQKLPYEHAKALVDKLAPPGKADYKPEHHAKGTYWDIKY